MPASLYSNVVKITEDYLGPAADRFIARQIEFHLSKQPQELTAKDLPQLTEWAKVAIGLLTEDREMVEQFSARLGKLA